ncbi:HAD-IB family hydrolase [Pengzhenrongella sp.]|uniref:HAD-IB family hydrolase n=1 Tax=Pengzhenrongella sp. TaxID=2888820 RepID=UPI002F9377B8
MRATQRLVVWDVDRTLTRSDTLVPFLRTLVRRRDLPAVLLRVAVDVVRGGGRRAALKDALLRRFLAGRRSTDVEASAARYAQIVLERGCRPDSLERWAWHRGRGDVLVLASASPGLYVRVLGELLGAQHVLATELAGAAGRLTGERSGPNCRGHDKAARIADLVARLGPGEVWVYTDSRSDVPSLALADVPVRVRRYRRLTTPPPTLPPTGRRSSELVRFALTGVAAYLADVAVFNLALLVLRMDPLAAKALSSVVAITVAYLGSRYYTWPDALRRNTAGAVARFVAISVAAALVQVACLWLSHHVLGLTSALADNLAANVVGMALATALRFWAFRRFVFAPEESLATADPAHDRRIVAHGPRRSRGEP